MSRKVLIVEDALFISEIIKNICIQNNFEVVGEVQNGVDAITQSRIKNPDIIFMDLILPEMNGVEASDHILKENSEVMIIACTSENNEWIVDQARKIGIRHFIFKPFSKSEIEKMLYLHSKNNREFAHG